MRQTFYVLVVDDLLFQRDLLARILGRAGFAVGTAENGQDALNLVRERCPSVIVLDIAMPVMDGVAFSQELPRLGLSIPIVVMSASEDVSGKADQVGAVAFSPKPVDPDWLVATLDRICASVGAG
jgi:CheY-like chemotaxis protein